MILILRNQGMRDRFRFQDLLVPSRVLYHTRLRCSHTDPSRELYPWIYESDLSDFPLKRTSSDIVRCSTDINIEMVRELVRLHMFKWPENLCALHKAP